MPRRKRAVHGLSAPKAASAATLKTSGGSRLLDLRASARRTAASTCGGQVAIDFDEAQPRCCRRAASRARRGRSQCLMPASPSVDEEAPDEAGLVPGLVIVDHGPAEIPPSMRMPLMLTMRGPARRQKKTVPDNGGASGAR